jgi:endonuclease/exonuclease/phosphatase family metal-dependent hydrolase
MKMTKSKTVNLSMLAAAWMVAGCSAAEDFGDSEGGGEELGSTAAPLREDNIRVLTLNVRIDEAKANLERFQTRRPRINSVIRSLNPDVIGLQEVEEHFWDDIKSDFSDYHSTFYRRGGQVNPNEGVALLARKARFTNFHDCDGCKGEETLVYADRATCLTDDLANRNIVRIKVEDKITNRSLDIFNTHFPSGKDCDKERMARKVARWVDNYKDNVILMGDFNTGYSVYGGRHDPYSELLSTSGVPLYNAYKSVHGVSYGESFITDKADSPERRLGSMIDHVMFGPAYVVDDAGIDRSLFLGSTRINCDDAHSVYDEPNPPGSVMGPGGERIACIGSPFPTVWPVAGLASYSDHWAVWADLRRIDCPNGC